MLKISFCQKSLFGVLFLCFSVLYPSLAQTAYTGAAQPNLNLKIGDKVEATYAGSWLPAEIVGAYDAETGTYQIHFEGEKYCSNHRLDSRLKAEYVRTPPIQEKSRNDRENSSSTSPQESPTPKATSSSETKTSPKPSTTQSIKPTSTLIPVGSRVNYAGAGVIWSKGGKLESYDPEKRQYLVRDASGSGDIVPCYAVHQEGSAIDHSFFFGDWEVKVNGATTTFVKGNDLYRRVTGGMRLPPLRIHPDGTYSWLDTENKVIQGKWVPRPEGVPGIVILNGLDGMDWTVYEKTEGYSPSESTRDEIGFHHIPSETGYYSAYRIGPNQSCVLVGRTLKP